MARVRPAGSWPIGDETLLGLDGEVDEESLGGTGGGAEGEVVVDE